MYLVFGILMVVIFFILIFSVCIYYVYGVVIWLIVVCIMLGIIVGMLLGIYVVSMVLIKVLGFIFIIFICYVLVQMIINKKFELYCEMLGMLGILLVGVGIGVIFCLVVIGGGVFLVFFMIWCNVWVQNVIGMLVVIGFLIVLGGVLGYIWNGWLVVGLFEGSLGFVYLLVVIGVVVSSILMVLIGVWKIYELLVKILK